MRRTSERRGPARAAAIAALAIVGTSCAGSDPTSRPSPGFVPVTEAAPTTPTADTDSGRSTANVGETIENQPPDISRPATASAGNNDPAPDASPAAGTEPTRNEAGDSTDTDANTGTDASTETDADTDAGVRVDASVFTTDEPSFDAEPLQPFEIASAATPVAATPVDPPDGSAVVDATEAEALTGWAAFDRSLEDALLRNGNTAASVAVSIGGDIVHEDAFGLRLPLINDEATAPGDRFRIASISKPITAITLLQLVEEGVVGLDDEVGQLVADRLGIEPSNGARRITIRRLLNHTSGFGKYDTQFFRKGADSCEDAARLGMRQGSGSGGYRYSNMNYCVAGVLIEALTGKSYEAAAYEQVLTPLGLSGMRLANTFDPGPGEVLHPTTAGRNYMETLGGAGSWIASPSDLVTIIDSLDHSTPGFKPLDPETVDLMATPVGGVLGQRGYGLGLISYGDGRYGHTGTIESTHAMVLNRGDGVIWSITVAGPYPDDTPRLEGIINQAFVAAGFIAG